MQTPPAKIRQASRDLGISKVSQAILLMACLLNYASTSAFAASSFTGIALNPSRWNVGSVFNTALQTNLIQLRNCSNETLEITNVIPDCALCTRVLWRRSTLAPGESMSLDVKFDPIDLEGFFSRGITILGNHPTYFPVRLECEGSVKRAFAISPPAPVVLVRGKPGGESVDITPLIPLRSRLTEVQAGPNLSASIAYSDPKGTVLRLTPAPAITSGWEFFSVTVSSTNAADPSCRISGAIFTPSLLDWFPDYLRFSATTFPVTKLLHLRLDASSTLSIRDVITASENLRCEIERPNAAGMTRIHVTKAPTHPKDPATSSLTVLLSAGEGETYQVKIPVEFAPPR